MEQNSYQISPDGLTLTYPDGHTEPIVSGEYSMDHPDQCYEERRVSQYFHIDKGYFSKTKCAIRMYKKTRLPNSLNAGAITIIVIPAGTDIHLEKISEEPSKYRVALGIVGRQYLLNTGEELLETISHHDWKFVYKTGSVVEPKKNRFLSWSDNCLEYDDWVERKDRGLPYRLFRDPVCAPGIHVFATEAMAQKYDFQ